MSVSRPTEAFLNGLGDSLNEVERRVIRERSGELLGAGIDEAVAELCGLAIRLFIQRAPAIGASGEILQVLVRRTGQLNDRVTLLERALLEMRNEGWPKIGT